MPSAFDHFQHSIDDPTIAERSRRIGCAAFYTFCILSSISYDFCESGPSRGEPFGSSAAAWRVLVRSRGLEIFRTKDGVPKRILLCTVLPSFLDCTMTWLMKHSEAKGQNKEAVYWRARLF